MYEDYLDTACDNAEELELEDWETEPEDQLPEAQIESLRDVKELQ